MTLNKRVMIRLSDEVYEELDRVARHNRRPPSTLARFLIEGALGFADEHVIVIPEANNGRDQQPTPAA